MRRSRLGVVAFSLLAAILIVTAQPAAASHTAVASIHTTDTDFNGATTLDNVSISGSGVSATVNLDSNIFLDGFEDESADSGIPDAWENVQAPAEQNVTTVLAAAGSQSYYIEAGGTNARTRPSEQPYGSAITGNVSVSIYANSTAGDDGLRLFEGGTRVIVVAVREGDLQYFDGSWNTIATQPDIKEWVNVTIYNIDPNADTFAVDWEAGADSGQQTGLSTESPMANGYDQTNLFVGSGSGAAFFDEFSVGDSPSFGTYIGSAHSVENPTQGFTNLTLQNATAHVTWQSSADGGSTWSDVASTSFTSSGNHTVALSGPDTDWRVNVTFVSEAGSTTAELHDEGVQFQAAAPSADDASASPGNGETIHTSEPTFEVDISDFDFSLAQGDTVDITLFVDGTQRDADGNNLLCFETLSISQNTTFSRSAGAAACSFSLSDGDHTWHVVMNDSYGHSITSTTYSFTVQHFPPVIDNSSLFPNGTSFAWDNRTLSADITDGDFPLGGDSVDAEFFVDGVSQGTDTLTSNGTATLDVTGLSEGSHNWHVVATDDYGNSVTSATASFTVDHHDPQVDNSSMIPVDGAQLQQPPSTLKINASDGDFGKDGDTLTAEFFLNGNSVGTDTLNSNGTATVSISDSDTVGGTNTWNVTVTDSYGQSITSQTNSYEAPDTLFLRNETNVSQKITSPVTADLTFFGSAGTIEDREITNGELDMTGLPVSETFIVTIDPSENYHRRTFIIESLYQQQTAFLLSTSQNISSSNITFSLQDFTGEFPAGEDTTIYVERAINRSKYSGGGTGIQWTVVSGDRFDAAGEFTDTLQNENRYRIKVENIEGDLRVLGSFTPREDATAVLQVRGLTFGVNGTTNDWTWNTTIIDSAGSPSGKKVVFNFTDPTDSTSDLRLKIYERGNASNEIHNTSYAGAFGSLSVSENIPAGENGTAWVVDFSATHDGSSISQQRVLSPRSSLVPTLDTFWKQVASILIILMVAFLFSRVNAAIGGIVTAIVAGMLWQIQWMGGSTSGAAILIAIATAAWVHYAGRETVP